MKSSDEGLSHGAVCSMAALRLCAMSLSAFRSPPLLRFSLIQTPKERGRLGPLKSAA